MLWVETVSARHSEETPRVKDRFKNKVENGVRKKLG